MFLTAIAEVDRLEGRKRALVPPGAVFEIDDTEGNRLKKLKAARDPSEAEMALYEKHKKTSARSAKKAAESKDKVEVSPAAETPASKPAKGGKTAKKAAETSQDNDDIV